MLVNGYPQRTIWMNEGERDRVWIIDQRHLPHDFVTVSLHSVAEIAVAIKDMWLRGAPLIGAAAAYGMYFACVEAENSANFEANVRRDEAMLRKTRPTAVNLMWALDRQLEVFDHCLANGYSPAQTAEAIRLNAEKICNDDVEICSSIGDFGLSIIEEISRRKNGETVNILTHCNAGWVACIDWGTATSPIYKAHDKGIKVHVWVDETRPRNQGGRITAWELGQHGVPHTIVADNTGGHLMQHGMVDMCIVGTDRVTRQGDVANKIGTYLKALAAHANGVPFYVALPSTTMDWNIGDGVREIPIETRTEAELHEIDGRDVVSGEIRTVRITPPSSPALNYGFDVTPARYVTALITERGICPASEDGLLQLFPERK